MTAESSSDTLAGPLFKPLFPLASDSDASHPFSEYLRYLLTLIQSGRLSGIASGFCDLAGAEV